MTTVELPKYLQNRLANMEYPRLLITKEKYGDTYYLINNQEALFKAALLIIEARLDGRWLVDPGPNVPGLKPALSKDAAKALPEPYRTQALADLAYNERRTKQHADAVNDYARAKRAVDEGNGALAYMVLDDRMDHEYEGYKLETLVIP